MSHELAFFISILSIGILYLLLLYCICILCDENVIPKKYIAKRTSKFYYITGLMFLTLILTPGLLYRIAIINDNTDGSGTLIWWGNQFTFLVIALVIGWILGQIILTLIAVIGLIRPSTIRFKNRAGIVLTYVLHGVSFFIILIITYSLIHFLISDLSYLSGGGIDTW